jgi:hypothetical protein
MEPSTPTEPIRIYYYGIYDPGQPEEVLSVQLFGAKRWHEDGWVYRLEGEVVVAREHDYPVGSRLYYYDDILVYMVQGRIYCASDPVFMDTTGKHEYKWEDLEYVINNYEMPDDEETDPNPITDEEIMYVFQEFEDDTAPEHRLYDTEDSDDEDEYEEDFE